MKALALLFIFPTTLFARIGESPIECSTRYGQPSLESSDGKIKWYEKNQIRVTVHFRNDIAVQVHFEHSPKGLLDLMRKLTDEQIQHLLFANSMGGNWKPISRTQNQGTDDITGKKLARGDSLAHAYWDYPTGSLTLITIAEEQAREKESILQKQAKAAAAAKSTKGF